MAIDLQAAIAVFDKSADRTRPNAQTEAWAVIRAELMRVMGAPVCSLEYIGPGLLYVGSPPDYDFPETLSGQRARLVPADGGSASG